MSSAIVIGSEGQDGQLISRRLVHEGWDVVGIGRRLSSQATPGDSCDITDSLQVAALVERLQPTVIYYLAAYHQSSEGPERDQLQLFKQSHAVHVEGVLHFLEALSLVGRGTLFYAGSSLVFGNPDEQPQTENTAFRPLSPYAITKAAGIRACQYYRESRGVRASTGILYNHESPLRREAYVSQKIARAVARISRGSDEKLALGDLEARVDWGYAPDFVDAMVRISALPQADDFIIATGELHTVREFVEIAFAHAGIDWRQHVREDPSVLTRTDTTRVGDPARLRERTGWAPSLSFPQMVRTLVDAVMDPDGS